jgi:tetratricopeptide (TPR) repeat protein
MYCRKCGTEVQSEHEEYCKNCNTQTDHVSVGIGSASQNDKAILGGSSQDLGSSVPEKAKNDFFHDDDTVKPTDPIDFLLEEPSEPIKNESKIDLPDEDLIEAEPAINALTNSEEDDKSETEDYDFGSINDDYDDDETDKADQVDEDVSFEETEEEEPETSDKAGNFDDFEEDEPETSDEAESFDDLEEDEPETSDEAESFDNLEEDETETSDEAESFDDIKDDEPDDIDEPIFGYTPEDFDDDKKKSDEAQGKSEKINEFGDRTFNLDKPEKKKEEKEYGERTFNLDKSEKKKEEKDHSKTDSEIAINNKAVVPDEIISEDDQPISELFDDTENKKHTQKIDLEEVKKEINMAPPKKDIPKAKNLSTKKIPILNEVVKPKGVAYLKGNNLSFSGGFKPFSGQELTIEDKVFQIKTKQTNTLQLYGYIGAGIVAFIIFVYILSSLIGTNYGQVAGVVYGSYGSKALADQVVKVKETGETTTTNHAGFFVFDNLKSGVYTLQYIDDGLVVNERTVTVLKDKTSTIILGDSGSQAAIDEGYIENDVASSTPPVQQAVASIEPVSTEIFPGILKLSIRPSNAKAYLNNKPLGTGSKTYKVTPGTYTLAVKKNGYITETEYITVRPEKSLSYTFNLTKNNNELTDSKSLYNKAHDYEIAGDYDNAITYYNYVLNNDSKHVQALAGKGRCYKKQGKINESLSLFVQASKAAKINNDLAGRIEAINGIITIKPNNYTAYYDRGKAYFSLKNYSKASADFQKVVSLDKRHLKAYYYLGDSFYAGKHFNEALFAYQAAEELHFADPKAQVQLAKTHYALGDLKNAKKAYEKFTDMASNTQTLEFNNDPEWRNIVDTFSEQN